jgi:hypothetical protein
MNASLNVGVTKGWMTNLHTCVQEDCGDCDLDCEKGYKEGFTSMADLCRCKEKEGKLHGYMYDDKKTLIVKGSEMR